MTKYFISHASEDKKEFVKPLADRMLTQGATVFYDEYSIELGDSLFESINKGIQEANIGIIVLSPSFFNKGWTNAELNSIFNKHISGECKIIPIFHQVTPEDVKNKYPLISDILGVKSEEGIIKISNKILKVGGITPKPMYLETDFTKKPDNEPQHAWTIMVGGLDIMDQINPNLPKTILEIGEPFEFKNKVSLYVERNELLVYKITDGNRTEISLSTELDKWITSEGMTVFCTYNKVDNSMKLIIDDQLIKELSTSKLDLPNSLLSQGKMIIGCTLEITDPCFFSIGSTALFNKELTIKDCINMRTYNAQNLQRLNLKR